MFNIKERVSHALIHRELSLSDGTIAYRLLILLGRTRGNSFTVDNPSLRYVFGCYEPEVTSAMNRLVHKGDIAYDIGAHAGYLSMHLSKLVGEKGRVFSFEPSPQNRDLLERNRYHNKLTNLVVIPHAVTDTQGTVSFVTTRPSYSSHIARDGEKEAALTVPSITIDAFVASGKGLPPAFIKLDAEGEERAVLKGAARTLTANRPVVIAEVSESNLESVRDLMESSGYTWQVLSKAESLNYQMGTPNILFLPTIFKR